MPACIYIPNREYPSEVLFSNSNSYYHGTNLTLLLDPRRLLPQKLILLLFIMYNMMICLMYSSFFIVKLTAKQEARQVFLCVAMLPIP